jgi:patatin-like phospholipase/acyl hydrolase
MLVFDQSQSYLYNSAEISLDHPYQRQHVLRSYQFCMQHLNIMTYFTKTVCKLSRLRFNSTDVILPLWYLNRSQAATTRVPTHRTLPTEKNYYYLIPIEVKCDFLLDVAKAICPW